jgi:hypothetical protein
MTHLESAKLFLNKKRPLPLRFITYVKKRYSKERRVRHPTQGPKPSAQLATLDQHKALSKGMGDLVHYATVVTGKREMLRDAFQTFTVHNCVTFATKKGILRRQGVGVIFICSTLNPKKNNSADFVVTTHIGPEIVLSMWES